MHMAIPKTRDDHLAFVLMHGQQTKIPSCLPFSLEMADSSSLNGDRYMRLPERELYLGIRLHTGAAILRQVVLLE